MKTNYRLTNNLLTFGFLLVLTGCNLLPTKTPETEASPSISPETTLESSDSFTGTLTDLLTYGKSVSCNFSYTDEESGSSNQGTVYVDNTTQNMRGEFQSSVEDTTFSSNLIRNGDYSYVWGDLYPQGIKVKNADWEKPLDNSQTTEPEGEKFDYQGSFEYKCQPWTVDQSLFNQPTDVEFMDFSETLGQYQDTLKELNPDACGACDALSGESKTTCLDALGC